MQLSVLLSALVSVTVFVAVSPTPGVTLRSSCKREKLDTKFECDLPEEGDGPVIAEGINKKHEELKTNFIDYKVGSTKDKKREKLETDFIDYKVGSIGDKKRKELETNSIDYKAGSTGDKKCEELKTNFIDYKVGLSGDKCEELKTSFIDYKLRSTVDHNLD
ncbi:hypothetical protein EDB19DRAFT_2029259 [Suillus lakei]|nr:hypothetical protein EDB19DRAFT_2029259 [Suillus lakei]